MWPESLTTTCKKAKKAARDKMEAARQLNRTVITFTIRGAHPRKDGTAGFLGKLGHSGVLLQSARGTVQLASR